MQFRHRYYSTELGRFLTRDPLALQMRLSLTGGRHSLLRRVIAAMYRFARGNPVAASDPLGLLELPDLDDIPDIDPEKGRQGALQGYKLCVIHCVADGGRTEEWCKRSCASGLTYSGPKPSGTKSSPSVGQKIDLKYGRYADYCESFWRGFAESLQKQFHSMSGTLVYPVLGLERPPLDERYEACALGQAEGTWAETPTKVALGTGTVAAGAAAVVGSIEVMKETRVLAKMSLEGPHHSFPLIGDATHLRIGYWLKGISGSGKWLQIPLWPG